MAVKEPAPETNGAQTPQGQSGIDKKWLQEQFAAMDARAGFIVGPAVTAQQVRAMMLADGIRPEDNAFSRSILRERYPDDYIQDISVTDDTGAGQA